MQKTKLDNLMKRFEEYLMIEKGLLKITAEGYARSVSIALKRMRKDNPPFQDIKSHILWMHEKKYSYSHIANSVLALERFSEFKGSPIHLGRMKKPKRVINDFLSEAEIGRMVMAADDIRKKSIVTVLAYSGIRNQELCNLKVEDVNLGRNEVHVKGGKNRKDRVVSIASECTNLLVQYLNLDHKKTGDFLFTTVKHGNQLTTSDVRKIIKTLGKKANVDKRVHPHKLRHSLASQLLNRGASIIMIKEQLGHAFLDSTVIYIHSMASRAKTEYEFYKPSYI